MKFENKKIVTIFFFVGLALVISLYFFLPEDQLSQYTSLALVIITMLYAYFTYLILIISKTSGPLPYIDAEFIVTDKLTQEFINKYGVFLREDDRFKRVEDEAKASGFNKNLVFLKATNIGSGVALDVIFDIRYQFNNVTDFRKIDIQLTFGNIGKEGGYNIKLVDIYNNPRQTDYFKLEKCTLELNDISNKQSGEGSYRTDFFQEVKPLIEEGVSINFSKEKK